MTNEHIHIKIVKPSSQFEISFILIQCPFSILGIVMQIYSVGVVCHLGIQSTAAALVSATRASDGDDAARSIADRTFVWGSIVGIILGMTQVLALPVLVPLFSTIPEVQEAGTSYSS